MNEDLKQQVIDYSLKLNSTNLSPLRSGNLSVRSKIDDDEGNIKKVRIYPKKSNAMNLAFDVTPAKYVTGLITEEGICEASTEGLKKLFK